jgi:rhodanese-related sulfurtransferase
VLFSVGGYTYLDVRPSLELEAAGKVKGCVNIPIVNSKWVYDAEAQKKVTQKEPNAAFVDMVKKRFPNTEAPLLIACSDGRTYSIDALEALDEAGYTRLVGLRGGYYNFFKVFDNKLARRRFVEPGELYSAGGDSAGIHSSGAGFEKMDGLENWAPPSL